MNLISLIIVLALCATSHGEIYTGDIEYTAGSGGNEATIANFDNLSLSVDSYWSGNYTVDGTGGTYDTSYFNSDGASFENHSDGDWGAWAGFAYSNITDNTTPGWGNEAGVYTGYAHSGSNFGIGYEDAYNGFVPTMLLDTASVVSGLYVANTTYAGLAMLNGEGPATKFGGASGDDADWFLLTITGKNDGGSTGTVEFYLADYSFVDNSQDYIVDTWELVDTSSLGIVDSLEFTLSSSDMGQFGMNTPAYFALDTVIPEPATMALMALGAILLRRKSK